MSLGLESIAHFLFGFGSCANDDETLLLLPLIPRDETVCDGLSEAQTVYLQDFLSRLLPACIALQSSQCICAVLVAL